eukprot:6166348-Amphidinium_carterae.1
MATSEAKPHYELVLNCLQVQTAFVSEFGMTRSCHKLQRCDVMALTTFFCKAWSSSNGHGGPEYATDARKMSRRVASEGCDSGHTQDMDHAVSTLSLNNTRLGANA